MSLIKKITYVFTREQKIKFIILFFLVLGGAVAETVGVSLIMPFISIVAAPETVTEQPVLVYIYNFLNLKSSNEFLILMALLLIFVYIAKNVYLFVMYKLEFRFVYNNQMRLSTKLMDCYMKKPYEYHINKNSSETIRSVTNDVEKLFVLILNVLLLITEVLVVLCIGTFLIIIEPVMMTSVIILLGVVLLIFMVIYKKKLTKAGVNYQQSQGLMIKWINQGIGGIKEIKVMKREKYFIDSYSKSAATFAETQQKYMFTVQIPKLFIECLCVCGILIAISIMLYNDVDASSMISKLAVFAMAAFRIMPSFNKITACYNTAVFYNASIDLVYHDLKETEDTVLFENSASEKIHFQTNSLIRVKNMSYRYPNTINDVLKDVSFEIPLKKSVAIVGPSGSGKTTFADIFLGLLSPSSGEITINGVDIHKNVTEWAAKLGYIPQNIYLCDDSIKSNVAFGIDEDKVDESKVWMSLEKAQLKSFIDGLPESINTVIGERGIKLSGGQRQRIGIARAFYNDPEILILDEATSSLDSDTESAVMDAIDAVKNEKTLIIIAHRLSTIKNCDLAFKVEDSDIKLFSKEN